MQQQRMGIGKALQRKRDIGGIAAKFTRQIVETGRMAAPRNRARQGAADGFVGLIDHRRHQAFGSTASSRSISPMSL